MATTALEKNIMRRVYYAYGLAIVSHTMFWQGALLGASVALFGRLTHVASLINNFLSVPVGSVPAYVGGAVSNALVSGEIITLFVTGAMIVLTLSVAHKLVPRFIPTRQLAI
jgi:hypothetical protein